MKRLLPVLSCALLACGPESPTPAAPEAPAPSAQPSLASSGPKTGDRTGKAKKAFVAMEQWANTHDATKVREVYAADAVKGTVSPDGWKEIKGVEAIEKQTAAMFTSTPDIQWKSVRVFLRDDLAVDEYVVAGTNPATGKRAGIHGVALHWFDDAGKIKKEHVYIDQLTMLIHTGRAEGKAPEPATMPTSDTTWVVAKNDANEEANVATFKATWPAKALLARDFEHDDMATGALYKGVPMADFVADEAWGFGNFVVAEMQMKGPDGILKHVVEVAEHDKGQLVRAKLYSNRLEGKGLPPGVGGPANAPTSAPSASPSAAPAKTNPASSATPAKTGPASSATPAKK